MTAIEADKAPPLLATPTSAISRRFAVMDVPASPEPVAAATFLQRIGLSRLLLWAKTAWRRSDSERNRRFSYQVVVSSVTTPAEDHRYVHAHTLSPSIYVYLPTSSSSSTPTPEPAQQAPFEDPFEKMVQQKAEQDAMPPRASVVPEEPDKPKQPEEVEKREEPEVAEEPEEPQEVEEREEPQEVKEPEEPEEAEEQEEPEEPEEQEYPTKAILRSQVHAERLRKMTEQYNLPIPDDLLAYATPPKEQSRVHRPVRMRVHRSCHRCNTMFGETRVCTGCQHRVCARCQPVQRQNYADSWSPISHDRLAADLEVDDFQGLQEQITMLRASRTSSQTLVRKELRQRVRRRCHSCSALFGSGNRTCTNCQHVCCAACPRFP